MKRKCDSEGTACGLGAAFWLEHQEIYSGLEWYMVGLGGEADKFFYKMGFSPEFISGFIDGFDNHNLELLGVNDSDAKAGYAVGQQMAAKYVNKRGSGKS
jgi:hypothetical protein